MNHGRHPQRNIVLTGFYGSNTAAVGLELSRRMRRPYIDLNAELRRRAGRLRVLQPVPAGNHDAERSVLADLAYRQETIIDVGVETVAHGEYYEELHDFSFIVFIDPPFDALRNTLRSDYRQRGLLESQGEEALYAQWQALRPRFERCDFQLVGAHLPPRAAGLIIHSFFT